MKNPSSSRQVRSATSAAPSNSRNRVHSRRDLPHIRSATSNVVAHDQQASLAHPPRRAYLTGPVCLCRCAGLGMPIATLDRRARPDDPMAREWGPMWVAHPRGMTQLGATLACPKKNRTAASLNPSCGYPRPVQPHADLIQTPAAPDRYTPVTAHWPHLGLCWCYWLCLTSSTCSGGCHDAG